MTTNIVFDHRGRTPKGKEGPVEIRITHNRLSVYVNTGVKCTKKNFRDGYIRCEDNEESVNNHIKRLEGKAIDIASRMIVDGEALDGKVIRQRMFQTDKSAVMGDDFLKWFIAQEKAADLKAGTLKHYKSTRYRLEEWGGMSDWRQVTVENVCEFDKWLHDNLTRPLSDAERKAGVTPKPISDAGVYNYHKCLKAMLNRAVLFGKIAVSPYDRLKGKFKRGDKDTVEFLTEKEMRAVIALHPMAGTEMAAARDLFVFQMETGISYADTQAFDFSEYSLINGRYVNLGHRVKNGVQYVAQLSDECLEILGRYGMALPKMDNSDYNKCLKALAAAVGIEKRLHSHMARHSFATYMVAKGARIENVSKMLGHTNITQTQRYAKILPESVLADFDKVRGNTDAEAQPRRTEQNGK